MARQGLAAPMVATPIPATAPPMIPDEFSHPGLSLTQMVTIVWAYRKYTLLVVLGFVLLAGAVGKLSPRKYASTATLMVTYNLNNANSGSEFPMGLANYMATQIELMQSPEVLLRVVDRLKLTQDKHYTAGFHGTSQDHLREWVEKALAKKLNVELGNGGQLIYVTFTSDDPVMAADVANTVSEVYSEQQYQRATGPASERARRYTEQLNELKDKVGRAEEQVTKFRQRTGLIDFESKIDVEMQQFTSLQDHLLDAQNALRAAEVQASADHAHSSDAANSMLVQSLKSQLATQQTKMAELRTTLGPRHPDVVQLQSQIDSTQNQLDEQIRSLSQTSSASAASARQLVNKLQKAVDDQRDKVLKLRELRDEGEKYLLELESAQTVYKRALDGYDEIMFSSTGNYSNVSFVSRATPPLQATKPSTKKVIVLGAGAGLFFGLAGPLVFELLNRRVRCRDDLERDHGLPVLMEFGPLPGLGSAES